MGIASAVICRVSSVAANPRLLELLIDALAHTSRRFKGQLPSAALGLVRDAPSPAFHVFGFESPPVLGSSIKAASSRG